MYCILVNDNGSDLGKGSAEINSIEEEVVSILTRDEIYKETFDNKDVIFSFVGSEFTGDLDKIKCKLTRYTKLEQSTVFCNYDSSYTMLISDEETLSLKDIVTFLGFSFEKYQTDLIYASELYTAIEKIRKHANVRGCLDNDIDTSIN